MRGLTSAERAVLLLRDDAETEFEDISSLLAVGRMRMVERPFPDPNDEWYATKTDLGALALRVCPVE